MIDRALKEAERIRNELNQIERMALHVERDWQKFITLGDDAYLKAVAYDLHGFYTGLERIFHSVADTIDDHVPGGESWHRDLLEQMGKEMKGLRPALLSRETVTLLDEFLRFRHRIRNIYSFNLVPERIKVLVEKLPGVYKQVKSNLTDFSHFLERFFVTAKEA